MKPINASPTKNFFVEMLTRDIDLKDAILDLLDNCIDGIQRTNRSREIPDSPYKGFWAKIDVSNEKFRIVDNCGGIPLKVAQDYAFRMGKPEGISEDDDIYTIGTYGIGMKRAIFKMGRSAQILSQTQLDSFEVLIQPEWLLSDSWDLPIKEVEKTLEGSNGTSIEISELRDTVSRDLSSDSYRSTLVNEIESLYSYILGKGFQLYLNGKLISPKPIALQWEGIEKMRDGSSVLAPYLYEASNNDIEIKLAIGFYRELPTEEETDNEATGKRNRSELAGWSIVCNDRVVVSNDKTRLTGWGEATVPSYHLQFVSIAGIVHFKSTDARKLPVTTTKRGIDSSSDLYLYIKNQMREGLKTFTWSCVSKKWDKLRSRAMTSDRTSNLLVEQR